MLPQSDAVSSSETRASMAVSLSVRSETPAPTQAFEFDDNHDFDYSSSDKFPEGGRQAWVTVFAR